MPHVIHKNINKTGLLIQATLRRGAQGPPLLRSSADRRTPLQAQTCTGDITFLHEQSKPHGPVAACAPDSCLPGNRGAKNHSGSSEGETGAGGEVPPLLQPPTLQLHRDPPHHSYPPPGSGGMEVTPGGPAAIKKSCPSPGGDARVHSSWCRASVHPGEMESIGSPVSGHVEQPGCAGLRRGLTCRAGGAWSDADGGSPRRPAHRSPAAVSASRGICSHRHPPAPAGRAGSKIKLLREAKLSPLKIAQWNFPLKKKKRKNKKGKKIPTPVSS